MFVIAIVIVETVIATVIEYTAFESILKVRNIAEAQSPVVPRLKRSRCRSSQEVNDSPTPFSALNYC